MGLLGKKKKEEPKETTEELPKEELPKEELPKEELPKEELPVEKKGNFNLNDDEMALAVNALAQSEEFKVYQQMVIGQQIAEIIQSYNAAVKKKQEDEGLPSE